MKMSFRRRIKNHFIDLAARAALAILERQIAKDTPEQQERLREVKRAVVLMRRLSKLREATGSSSQEFGG